MRRFAHRLRGNKSTQAPASHVFLDTETATGKQGVLGEVGRHRLRLGHARFVRFERGQATRCQEVTFSHAVDWWQWLYERLSPHRPVWVWAHNAAFDLTILDYWTEVASGRMPIKFGVLADSPFFARCTPEAGRCVFVDSLNWWRCSLAELGDSVGVPKLPRPAPRCPLAELEAYCRRDVSILATAVGRLVGWLREHDLGVLRTTAAGQALQSYRHLGGDELPVIHANDRASKLERLAYHGHENRAYFVGTVGGTAPAQKRGKRQVQYGDRPHLPGPVHRLDANSLYGWCMRQEQYPWRLCDYAESCSLEGLKAVLGSHCVIATVLVDARRREYPVGTKTGLVCPRGRYWATLATPELQSALEYGDLVEVGAMALYERRPLFKQWVERLWAIRDTHKREGNDTWADLAKLLVNALPGKFGQRAHKWESKPSHPAEQDWGQWPEVDAESGELTYYRAIAGHVQEQGAPGEGLDSFPAISAHVTAYGRERMRHLRALAGPRTVLYQYADTLIVTSAALDSLTKLGLVKDGIPGKLRLQATTDAAEIHGTGVYRWGDQWSVIGLPRERREEGDGRFLVTEFERIDGIIAREGAPFVQVKEVVREIPLPGRSQPAGCDGWQEPPQW